MKQLGIVLTISAAVLGGFFIAHSTTNGSAATQTMESTKLITEQEAKEIALKKVNGTITEVDFDQDDNRPHYEFEIQSNNEEINIDVDAKTGKATITDRDKAEKDNVANTKPTQTNESNSTELAGDDRDEVKNNATTITEHETVEKDKVVNAKPAQTNGTASKKQDDNDQEDDVKSAASQSTTVKSSASKQNEAANTTVNPTTQTNTSATAKKVITKAEAIKIASTVAKGTVIKVELDYDDDNQTKTYELEFKDGNVEYDVEVDAYTGRIIEVNQDLED